MWGSCFTKMYWGPALGKRFAESVEVDPRFAQEAGESGGAEGDGEQALHTGVASFSRRGVPSR